MDDPLMWGILPLSYMLDLDNFRWGLGAHDICFKNRSVLPREPGSFDSAVRII